ncbi:MAG: hypothetical protein JWL76_2178 [Thermoleophilia bacterium]|nr:hypothetical protein [Thermoleophilia bacterium]
MLLATSPATLATAPARTSAPIGRPDDGFSWPNVGTFRPGGPGAKPSAHVVAQVNLTFASNFGAQGLIDVTAGPALQTFAKLDDALWGARALAAGRASLGVVKQADGAFTVNELTVPDVIEMGTHWDHVRDVTLIMGADPILPRVIDDLRVLSDGSPEHGQLQAVWTRSGNTKWTPGTDGRFRVSFNHM